MGSGFAGHTVPIITNDLAHSEPPPNFSSGAQDVFLQQNRSFSLKQTNKQASVLGNKLGGKTYWLRTKYEGQDGPSSRTASACPVLDHLSWWMLFHKLDDVSGTFSPAQAKNNVALTCSWTRSSYPSLTTLPFVEKLPPTFLIVAFWLFGIWTLNTRAHQTAIQMYQTLGRATLSLFSRTFAARSVDLCAKNIDSCIWKSDWVCASYRCGTNWTFCLKTKQNKTEKHNLLMWFSNRGQYKLGS